MEKQPKRALFICKGNWFRSQMAAAIYNKLTGTTNADSVGTYAGAPDEPEGQTLSNLFKTSDFFDVMERNGMYVRDHKTRRLQPEMLDEYELVVSMAQEPYVPDFLRASPKVVRWEVADPPFVDKSIAEDTYRKIEGLVRGLIAAKE